MKLRCLFLAAGMACVTPYSGVAQEGRGIEIPGNPLLADGDYYSADPAPFVADGALWILAGRDEAAPDVNDFIMREWQLFKTEDVESGKWMHYPAVARPGAVFAWAEADRAYAGQIVQAKDGRYYFYAPVQEKESRAEDRFVIGVAVAETPLGPWRDAHPAGPILSQRVPGSGDIQNIDPTVLVDDDGRVYIYWGTFGQLRAAELDADMVTLKSGVRKIEGLNGFFEAPWIVKRHGTYYMLYAANEAGPSSECTPTIYHACIAYGTAPSPFGPWTYRGVVLKPVSSTTSHPGVVRFKDAWYLAYHTADAEGGGHFRRSVALDRLEWDDSVSPARIGMVVPTRRFQAPLPPTRNIAGAASVVASNEPLPVKYWVEAVHDGAARENPLPPELWVSASSDGRTGNQAHPWIEYRWERSRRINGSRIWFWADGSPGAAVSPPAAWRLEYWDGRWKPIVPNEGYGVAMGKYLEVSFPPISTRCLRVAMDASDGNDGRAVVAVQEWEVLAPNATAAVERPAKAAMACEGSASDK